MDKVEDCGIFIGELNAPYENGKDFYENQVEQLFSKYREDLAKNGVTLDGNSPFYIPAAYCLLGNYDLAVISLIDDFHFGSKYFHPYGFSHVEPVKDGSVCNEDYLSKKGFNYHITVGSSTSESENYLLTKSMNTFLKSKNRYPFIGVSNIKVKNSLLIGAGYEVVHLALSALRTILTTFAKANAPFDFLVFEPISWCEISVVFFSDSFKKIADALLVIREMDVLYALENCELNFAQYADRIKTSVLKESLMHELLKDQPNENVILNSHLFTHTYSNLGIDIQWLWEYNTINGANDVATSNFLAAEHDEEFEAFTRWFVKPCYLEKFLNLHNIGGEFNLVVGNGDVEGKQERTDGLKDLLIDLRKFLEKKTDTPIEYANSIRKTKTIPRFRYNSESVKSLLSQYGLERKIEGGGRDDTYESVSNKLTGFVFDTSKIIKIRADLIKLKVSKSLRERIINAYINFNDGIQDPILYTNFSELYHYLIFLEALIELDAQQKVEEDSELRHSKYNAFVEFFDDAYKTNIIHSYRLYSVTDFNLDYNGGIQPIISGYDSFFKYFRRALRGNKELENRDLFPAITIVSGMPVIKTVSNVLRINYNYLFSPEFFLAALPKEAANHYFAGLTEISSGFGSDLVKELKKVAYHYRINRIKEAEERIRTLMTHNVTNKAIMALYMLGNAKEPIVSEFKLKLLDAIEKHDIAHERMLMLEYVETINQESFYYFLEDQFASIALGDTSYLFWAWAVYSQESHAYSFDLTLNEKKLHRLLLRLSVIANLQSDVHKNIYTRFSEAHALQISYHSSAMDAFKSIVLRTEIIPTVSVKDLINSIRELFRQLRLVPDYFGSKPLSAVENLKSGRVLFPDFGDSLQDIIVFLNSYLELVQSLFPEDKIVLRRNVEDGMPDVSGYSSDSRLLLDPTGGTFTIGSSVRRDYFKLRITLMKLLFNFSLKRKLLYFKKPQA